jgi:hypothetical protein
MVGAGDRRRDTRDDARHAFECSICTVLQELSVGAA